MKQEWRVGMSSDLTKNKPWQVWSFGIHLDDFRTDKQAKKFCEKQFGEDWFGDGWDIPSKALVIKYG